MHEHYKQLRIRLKSNRQIKNLTIRRLYLNRTSMRNRNIETGNRFKGPFFCSTLRDFR